MKDAGLRSLYFFISFRFYSVNVSSKYVNMPQQLITWLFLFVCVFVCLCVLCVMFVVVVVVVVVLFLCVVFVRFDLNKHNF